MIHERFPSVATIKLPREAVLESAPTLRHQSLFVELMDNEHTDLPNGSMMGDGSGKSVSEYRRDRLAAGAYILDAMEATDDGPDGCVVELSRRLSELKEGFDVSVDTQQKLSIQRDITLVVDAVRRMEAVIGFSKEVPLSMPVTEHVFETLCREITTAGPRNKVAQLIS